MKTLCASVMVLTLLSVALAQDARREEKGGKDIDQTFSVKASASDLAEINLSRIAVKSAGDKSVKEFAQQMIDDHSKTSKQLLEMANKKNLKVAERMDAEHDKMASRLAKLSGAEFDRAYMAGQLKDHEEAVALFEKQSKDGSDKDLKAWAEKTLPHLREHLKMAKDIHSKLEGKDKKER